jgi:Flp pilus assembly protein TadG
MVTPILLLLIGGAVQLGVIFAAKNTLVQIARDTARWSATQINSPCSAASTALIAQADSTAAISGLIGYTTGDWNATNATVYPDNAVMPAGAPNPDGVEVVWSTSSVCPGTTNAVVAYVSIRVSHPIPLFLPGLWLVAGNSCGTSGCFLNVSESAKFRMEPPPP